MAKETCSFEDMKELIFEYANVKDCKIRPESILKTELGIDSIYAVEMILELEEHYGIQMSLSDMESMITVSDVIGTVNRKLRG